MMLDSDDASTGMLRGSSKSFSDSLTIWMNSKMGTPGLRAGEVDQMMGNLHFGSPGSDMSKQGLEENAETLNRWLNALYSSDVEVISKLISQGINVNGIICTRQGAFHLEDDDGLALISQRERDRLEAPITSNLPIILAAENSTEVVAMLLEAGADVNQTYARAGTALQSAIMTCPDEQLVNMVKILLEGGADPNARPGYLGTALEAAANRADMDVLRMIVNAGANFNMINNDRRTTALTIAVEANNSKVVKYLLEKGADPNITTSYERERQWENVASEELWQEVGMHEGGPEYKPPIVAAALKGNLEIIKLLLQHGANINTIDELHGPPLVASALKKRIDIAVWLLSHGADASIALTWWAENRGLVAQRHMDPGIVFQDDIPPELRLWGLASLDQSFGTSWHLFHKIQLVCSSWDCREVALEWDIPEFVESSLAKGGSNIGPELDREVVLTATLRHRLVQDSKKLGFFRARTWMELIEEQIGAEWPDVADFCQGLVGHVSDHLQDIKYNTLLFPYQFQTNLVSVQVHCDWNQIRLTLDESLAPIQLQQLCQGLEVLCKTFRAERGQHPALSTATWLLERHEIAKPRETDQDMELGFPKYILRPSMSLSTDKVDLKAEKHNCWHQLFDMNTSMLISVDDHRDMANTIESTLNRGQGLGLSFELLLAVTAVEYPLIIDGGVVFVGYETILAPISINENFAQFHLLTGSKVMGQINPYKIDLGSRLKTDDLAQFQGKRCFLGWCEFAQINLGTRALPANVGYSGGVQKGKSLHLDGFEALSQLGGGGPLASMFGLHAKFKYTSHRLQFTPFGGYSKLLRDTAMELAVIYDAAKKRCFLVPKLSLLLHMCQAYSATCPDGPENHVPFVNGHIDAAEIIANLEQLGDAPIFGYQEDSLNFRQLISGLNTNLLATATCNQKSASKKLHGFEFMDVVTSPGRGTCMKALSVSSAGKGWLDIVNDVDAVVVCSNINDVITASPSPSVKIEDPQINPLCETVPEGLDYFTTTVACLDRLLHRRGIQLSSTGCCWPIKLTQGTTWELKGNPFKPCVHGIESPDTCWTRMDRVQPLCSDSYFALRPLKARKIKTAQTEKLGLPQSGALVFDGCFAI